MPSSADATARPPRILIADDDPQAAELMEAYLSDQGYDLAIAGDGEQALKQIAEWSPDLVLLDVMMPRLSGFEVCKRLRANPRLSVGLRLTDCRHEKHLHCSPLVSVRMCSAPSDISRTPDHA